MTATAIGTPGFLRDFRVVNTRPIPIPPPEPRMAGAVSTPSGSSLVSSSLSSTRSSPATNSPPTPGPLRIFLPGEVFLMS